MEWTTTGQLAMDDGIKVAVYGASGAGKTRLIPTAPRPVILSVEKGTLSIARENIRTTVIRTLKDLEEAYLWACTSTEIKNYDTICLDSISEMAEVILSNAKAATKDPRQAYGVMQDQIDMYVRLFRDIKGKNVYFTAKAVLKEQQDNSFLWSAMMPGKNLGPGLPFHFDEFLFLGTQEYGNPDTVTGRRPTYDYLLTKRNNQYEAKDRSGALDLYEQPNLTHIFNKIRAHVLNRPQPALA